MELPLLETNIKTNCTRHTTDIGKLEIKATQNTNYEELPKV